MESNKHNIEPTFTIYKVTNRITGEELYFSFEPTHRYLEFFLPPEVDACDWTITKHEVF